MLCVLRHAQHKMEATNSAFPDIGSSPRSLLICSVYLYKNTPKKTKPEREAVCVCVVWTDSQFTDNLDGENICALPKSVIFIWRIGAKGRWILALYSEAKAVNIWDCCRPDVVPVCLHTQCSPNAPPRFTSQINIGCLAFGVLPWLHSLLIVVL